jgi:hypothetical protein
MQHEDIYRLGGKSLTTHFYQLCKIIQVYIITLISTIFITVQICVKAYWKQNKGLLYHED